MMFKEYAGDGYPRIGTVQFRYSLSYQVLALAQWTFELSDSEISQSCRYFI